MSLTALTALINNNIRNKTPKVIKTEHADVEQAIVNEFFPAVQTITGTTVTGTPYTIKYVKQGNIVNLNLSITNSNAFLIEAGLILLPTILNPLFKSYDSVQLNVGFMTNIQMYALGDLFAFPTQTGISIGLIGSGETLNKNFVYISNND